jgi:hypothetical protein
MLRVNTKPRRRNAPRPAEKSAPAFLQWLRGRECVLAFNCDGKIEAAHVDHGGDKGMGTKAADRFALPMCAKHHREQHATGWETFQRTYGNFDALAVAGSYWQAWPGRRAWEAKNAG